MNRVIISVFGSARPQPGSFDYDQAYNVGYQLATAGCSVATGGYLGTMEAVSKGAHDAGGHVIGITSTQIEIFRTIDPNPYIVEETKYTTLRERLLHLVMNNDGIIALPGGVGTLAELAMAWNGMQTGEFTYRPMTLLGSHWKQLVDAFVNDLYLRPQDLELLHFSDTADAAVNYVLSELGVIQ